MRATKKAARPGTANNLETPAKVIELTFNTYKFIPLFLRIEVLVKNVNVATMLVPAKDWLTPATNKEIMREFSEWYVSKKRGWLFGK
jgi:hypothetical protein